MVDSVNREGGGREWWRVRGEGGVGSDGGVGRRRDGEGWRGEGWRGGRDGGRMRGMEGGERGRDGGGEKGGMGKDGGGMSGVE